jgi:hypothetical protein
MVRRLSSVLASLMAAHLCTHAPERAVAQQPPQAHAADAATPTAAAPVAPIGDANAAAPTSTELPQSAPVSVAPGSPPLEPVRASEAAVPAASALPLSAAQTATTQPERATELSPTWFWFGASATIITVSLGGFYALRVRDLYDQAAATPRVSPEQLVLRDQMIAAERTADLLFLGALALAAGTTVLAFHVDWSRPERARPDTRGARSSQRRWTLAPVVLPGEQSLQLRGALP